MPTRKKILYLLLAFIGLTAIYSFFNPIENQQQLKLSSDTLFTILGFPITNSITALWATMLIILILALFVRKNLDLKPNKIQLIFEIIINFFHDKMHTATQANKQETNVFLPIVLTVFLLFLIGNQFALLPIINHLTYNDLPLFRTPSADFSLTIAATVLIIFLAHIIAISKKPFTYFLNLTKLSEISKIRKIKEVPKIFLEIFLGLTDLIGEVAKVVSMSARLFGNVAAGELMVLVISGLAVFTFYLVPIPFIFLSSFSGLIQAFVFGLLGVQYSALTLNSIKENAKN